jgi:hypothetical protein|tara:strand:+ start:270 stop:431 length:162 start_codon:yes stop_codon:yes gene_type:complete
MMKVKLIRNNKIIERNQEDWEKNEKVYTFRGFKLYSEEKESKPKKKKKVKEDV